MTPQLLIARAVDIEWFPHTHLPADGSTPATSLFWLGGAVATDVISAIGSNNTCMPAPMHVACVSQQSIIALQYASS